ncbi:calcium-binding protein [Herbaspirillum sp. alder98]|uniref:calcium-binding protein n=1 Tax=Herbaspirillum sp. alder98 TaxID=2913096 RepID=UPI001CD8B982|nr:calcium-binding protein [Herbaspirillum sp. alder98]
MSNEALAPLAVPTVDQNGQDIVVTSADGQRRWQLQNYLSEFKGDARASKLAGLNFPVTLERHPAVGGDVWALGTAGDDVMVGGDFDVSVTAGDGDDGILLGAGNDYLDGGNGNDWLYAGAGNDSLVGGDGEDRLYGKAGDDMLQGGEGDDLLNGGSGDDRLYGGLGNDRLRGGPGNDRYVFELGDGQDRILNGRSTDDLDVVQFAGGITAEQLWFRKTGKNLEVSVIGTDDSVTIVDWYADDARRVDRFDLIPDASYYESGTRSLDMEKVEALVQAMSAFSPPPEGTTSLPQDYLAVLAPPLAAGWHYAT